MRMRWCEGGFIVALFSIKDVIKRSLQGRLKECLGYNRAPPDFQLFYEIIIWPCQQIGGLWVPQAKHIMELQNLPQRKHAGPTRLIICPWSLNGSSLNILTFITAVKCINKCGKTLWIISLVNNWESWWAHHVARRFQFCRRDQYLAFHHTAQLFLHVMMIHECQKSQLDWKEKSLLAKQGMLRS